jgi:hypothetical protein
MDHAAQRPGAAVGAAMILATLLGLLAAFLFALSAFLQQRAARESVGDHTVSLRESSEVRRLARMLPRSRTWLRGWLVNLCGWLAQAAALQVGSVAAVQPLVDAVAVRLGIGIGRAASMASST